MIEEMIEFLEFLWLVSKAYFNAGKNGLRYGVFAKRGIPYTCFFIGRGREAWRVSQIAIESEPENWQEVQR